MFGGAFIRWYFPGLPTAVHLEYVAPPPATVTRADRTVIHIGAGALFRALLPKADQALS